VDINRVPAGYLGFSGILKVINEDKNVIQINCNLNNAQIKKQAKSGGY
jgi:hypothetical protein